MTAQQFIDRTASVTGGGSGIGRATAIALAAQGALVTIIDRTSETLDEKVQFIEASGSVDQQRIG